MPKQKACRSHGRPLSVDPVPKQDRSDPNPGIPTHARAVTSGLPRYETARRALAECVRVDEAKEIRDWTIALEAYAYQAKDARLAADAAELKRRAERRIGQLIALQKKTVGTRAGQAHRPRFSENPS